MKRPLLNWGLLSTARINRAIIPPVRASKRSRLLAVGSRTRESAGEYAERWNIPRAHGSYEALLDDPEIDVIYNSLPNHLHAEWTIRALRAGKHVLCEKPIALTVRDVDAIAAAAKETGRIVAEAFMYRHHPVTLKVKEMVDGGEIGQLQYVRGSFSYTLTRESYRAKPEMGGGSLWDVGCYPISYARMLTGEEPVEVFGQQVIGEGGIDVTFVGEMRFPGGVLAQFDSGFHSPLRVQMEAAGSDGWLKVENPYKPGKGEHILFSRGDETQRIRVPGRELYIGEVEDLEDAVLKGAAQRITLEDSRGNIAVIQALIESARTGRPVNVERRE